MSAADRLAASVALALSTPHRSRAEREARPSPNREIACRSCGRWTTWGDAGPWRHSDGTLACLDPATSRPQVCARHGGELEADGSCWECDAEGAIAERDRTEYEGLLP